MQASQRAVLALAVAVVLAVAVGQEAAAPASAGTPPTHESRRTGAVAERELRSADYAIRRVVFYSPDVSDSQCELGGAHQTLAVSRLHDTNGVCEEYLYDATRPYFSLKVNATSLGIDSFKYGCTKSDCTDCITDSAASKLEYGRCGVLGQTTNSFYLQADMASCLGPLKAASTTPADGVSVVTFTGCGSPSSLREIYSLGALPTQANSQCLQIKGHQSASTARYYQLYGTGDGKVSGKWMCETEACETCLTEFNNVIIGKAGAEAQCDNYHQVWQSDALTPCGQSCSCDPPPPPSPPPSPAPGPSPAPPPRFVYINQYVEEDSPVVDCRVGNSGKRLLSRACTRGASCLQTPRVNRTPTGCLSLTGVDVCKSWASTAASTAAIAKIIMRTSAGASASLYRTRPRLRCIQWTTCAAARQMWNWPGEGSRFRLTSREAARWMALLQKTTFFLSAVTRASPTSASVTASLNIHSRTTRFSGRQTAAAPFTTATWNARPATAT